MILESPPCAVYLGNVVSFEGCFRPDFFLLLLKSSHFFIKTNFFPLSIRHLYIPQKIHQEGGKKGTKKICQRNPAGYYPLRHPHTKKKKEKEDENENAWENLHPSAWSRTLPEKKRGGTRVWVRVHQEETDEAEEEEEAEGKEDEGAVVHGERVRVPKRRMGLTVMNARAAGRRGAASPSSSSSHAARGSRSARAGHAKAAGIAAAAAGVARVSVASLGAPGARRSVRARAEPESVEEKIKEAVEVCDTEDAAACAEAWDEVEEVSAAAADKRQKAKDSDPLEKFCETTPDAEECKVYED